MKSLQCGNIAKKCIMKKQLDKLYQTRKTTKTYGRLGDITFTNIQSFLTAVVHKNNVPTGEFKMSQFDRIVGIGDIHGDFLALLSVLFMMDIIDINCNWKVGNPW